MPSNTRSYDVFLSFRGEDTRKNFTDHLYATLVAYGIHTFRDDEELEKGGDIGSDLSRAIEESRIFIIIFSKNYANSKWCLNELLKILECMTHKESMVLPIFYHVNPSDVRNQSGSFGDAFTFHEREPDQETKMMIQKWRIALRKTANLSGCHVDNQHEAEVIQKIREDVITRLMRKPLHVGNNIVGMDFHLKQLKSLIKIESDEVHMIGIYGIGGIGKTTIAMAVYNDISSQFDGSSFLRGVGEKSKGGLLELQRTLFQDIIKGKRPKFSDISEGINVIKERLHTKRVLIVLDDVNELDQLENLVGKNGWYGAKSRIIITTKDTSLLKQHGVDAIYEVKELNHEEAIELFNWWGFKQNIPKPKEDFESLSHCVVKYAKGLPIVLKVLGVFLFGRKIDEWKSALHKLKKIPHKKVQDVLKVSYDRLDDIEKEIFLDIVCFFKGKDKDFVSRILGRYAKIGIEVLHERCLITISKNKLNMHDLVQQMGREIIRQEYVKEPGKRSRLWDPDDIDSVLTRNTGTEAIEGLFVEVSKSNQRQFTTIAFKKMNRLRLLKVYHRHWGKVHLPMDFEFPSFELRYLHFYGYSLESLPTSFHGKNLVELDLMNSNIKQLWKGNEILDKLKVINLSNSKNLIEIPNFSSVPNLEILILEGCISIESLPRDFYKLKCLQSLSCAQCSKLKSFPEIKGNMRKLRKLDLSETAITKVPSSIEHLNGVEDLDLSNCRKLVILPESICNLGSLKTLKLKGFSELKGFPSSIEHLTALQHLDLRSCLNLVSLPESICTLSSLKTLQLDWCSRLEGCPEFTKEMENLESIELSATNINELPSSIGHLKALLYLDLSSCPIVSLPESIFNLSSLQALFLDNCLRLKGFPEIKVGDLKNLRTLDLRSTGIKELPSSIGCLEALEFLDLSCCKNLVNLPESICNLSSLKTLYVFDCLNLHGLQVDLGGLQCLEDLMLSHVSCEWGWLSGLGSLRSLVLSFCNLKQGVIRRDSFFSSLKRLYVRDCNLKEGGIPSDIWQLALVVFSVKHNHPTMEQDSSSHENFGHHGSAAEDPNRNAHNKRKYPTEQSLTEEPPHHKRFSGTQD